MRALRAVVTSVLAMAALVASLAVSPREASGDPVADAGAASSLPACIGVTKEARYVPYGYNHVVVVRNGCSKAASCTIATDVNPQPTSVDVASGATVEVLTFTGSPAQTFTPRVGCKLR
jgi:hypothetical protein